MSEQNVTIPAAELARLRAELTALRGLYAAAEEEIRTKSNIGGSQREHTAAVRAHDNARADAGKEAL